MNKALFTVAVFCKEFEKHSEFYGKRSEEGYGTITLKGWKKIATEYYEKLIPGKKF